jgi:hypothetical protein
MEIAYFYLNKIKRRERQRERERERESTKTGHAFRLSITFQDLSLNFFSLGELLSFTKFYKALIFKGSR